MKQLKYSDKKKYILKEKKLEKKHYRIIIGLMIFGVVYHYFIEPTTIGHDNRYLIYIFLLPTIIGIIVFGIYRRQFLINQFSTKKGFILWTFMIFYYLTQGIIFSYLSFGQVAKISWDYFNYETIKQNSEEVLNCQITKFWSGRRNSGIYFKFKNRNENFRVRYSTIKEFENKNVNNYYLRIKATKGLWNYYKVNDWEIKQK